MKISLGYRYCGKWVFNPVLEIGAHFGVYIDKDGVLIDWRGGYWRTDWTFWRK